MRAELFRNLHLIKAKTVERARVGTGALCHAVRVWPITARAANDHGDRDETGLEHAQKRVAGGAQLGAVIAFDETGTCFPAGMLRLIPRTSRPRLTSLKAAAPSFRSLPSRTTDLE